MLSLFRRRKANGNEDQNNTTTRSSDKNCGRCRDTPKPATRGKEKAATTTFRVKIPSNVRPGDEFQVYAGSRRVKLKCPQGARPGSSLAITVLAEKPGRKHHEVLNGPNVNLIPNTDPQAYTVTVPPTVRGGQKFAVLINGINMMVTSPPNATPGMSLQIVPPEAAAKAPRRRDFGQKFEVQVPENIKPGESFALLANGIRVLVQCPMNATSGQMVRFHLPFQNKDIVVKKLDYAVDGWARTLQVTQMKFQCCLWYFSQYLVYNVHGRARVSGKQKLHNNSILKKMHQHAYVRHLTRHGMELIPAQCELVESCITTKTGEEVVSCYGLIEIQSKPINEKVKAFREVCKKLGRSDAKNKSHLRIKVRRDHLLQDSMGSIMMLNSDDMKKLWRIQFLGEEGIDAGGLKREWFQLISEEMFRLETGLWQTCGENQMNLQIHPASGVLNEDHLLYFRFLGRIMGKALYDGELVPGHMVQTIYKHLLGWPVTFSDLEYLDPAYYKSIKCLMEMEDVEYACLDFSITEEVTGSHKTVELLPNGANVDVTNENLVQYLEAVLDYRLVGRVRLQLRELLLGFLDAIPPALLTIFDFQELELLLCGLPNIDLEDWMQNTQYSGKFQSMKEMDPICVWFWEIVQEMDEEKKARLLQFVTGTSGVPPSGFSILQGNDGSVRKFTVHGTALEATFYPRAHTCFNRIDLPAYKTKEELKEKLEVSITMVATGFDLE